MRRIDENWNNKFVSLFSITKNTALSRDVE